MDAAHFAPDAALTREQLAVILWRYAARQGKKTDSMQNLTQFADAGAISLYAVPALRWAHEKGLIGGTDELHLSPLASASRAELATILMRYLKAEG